MEFKISIRFGKEESVVNRVNAETQEEVMENIPEGGIYTFTDYRGVLQRVNLDLVTSISVNQIGKSRASAQSGW